MNRKSSCLRIGIWAAIAILFCGIHALPMSDVRAADLVMPTVVDPAYRIQALMPKTPVNGFNGLAFDS